MASLAPLLGLACTIRSFLMDAFRHHGSEKSQILANTAIGVAVACVPAALGIAVGLVALWAYRYFQGRLAMLDREMTVTAAVWMDWFRIVNTAPASSRPDCELRLEVPAAVNSWRVSGRLTIGFLAIAWLVRAVAYFWFDYMPLATVPGAAFRSLTLPFACTLFVSYAVCVDLLRRRLSTAVVISAAVLLAWVVFGAMTTPVHIRVDPTYRILYGPNPRFSSY